MRDGRIKVVPRKNVPPLNFNLRAVFYYVKREELIREYCRQVNESLHFIQKYMEGIVPAGRCSEELYWETKKISAELQKSNHEQTALIRAYLREAAQLYVEGEPWKTRITDRRLCRNTILNHLQMLANVSFWLREQGEPLAEEVCGWLLAQETADVQKVRSGQSLEVAREIYPAVQRKRA